MPIDCSGIAHDTYLVEKITDMVKYIAPVKAYAGEFEMEAMAVGALRCLPVRSNPKPIPEYRFGMVLKDRQG